ncbi:MULTISPECIES: hypothetical protein [16SrI (Aster yellows group)]|nr:hypothetical protein [Chrysanthemum yellows phytoplasma]
MNLLTKSKENFFKIFIGTLLFILTTTLTIYFSYNLYHQYKQQKFKEYQKQMEQYDAKNLLLNLAHIL